MNTTRCYRKDFIGGIVIPAYNSPGPDPWVKKITAAAGSPTVAGNADGARLTFDNTNEVQNLCLYFGDSLAFDIDDLISVEFEVALSALSSASKARWGLASARNDDPDAITTSLLFGASGGSTLTAESDDGTHEVAATDTGLTVTAGAWRKYGFTFGNVQYGLTPKGGKASVEFYAEDAKQYRRVLSRTIFDVSSYSSGLQPFVQLQKTASTNTGNLDVRSFEAILRRS